MSHPAADTVGLGAKRVYLFVLPVNIPQKHSNAFKSQMWLYCGDHALWAVYAAIAFRKILLIKVCGGGWKGVDGGRGPYTQVIGRTQALAGHLVGNPPPPHLFRAQNLHAEQSLPHAGTPTAGRNRHSVPAWWQWARPPRSTMRLPGGCVLR